MITFENCLFIYIDQFVGVKQSILLCLGWSWCLSIWVVRVGIKARVHDSVDYRINQLSIITCPRRDLGKFSIGSNPVS